MQTTLERFENKFTKTEGCWNWLAGVDKNGYGRFRFGSSKARANRVAYQLYKGDIPEGLIVRHVCDNPGCVNPEHLILGTHQDNTNDMFERGRQPSPEAITKNRRSYKGESHPYSKISESQAKQIIADQRAHAAIARDYGISRAAVSHLKRGLTWSHLHEETSDTCRA